MRAYSCGDGVFWADETAAIDPKWNIGKGTKIWHFTHIMPEAKIGRDCMIGQGCYVGSHAIIGNHVRIQNNVSVYDGVEIGDNVFIGPSVVFTNVKKPEPCTKKPYERTLIKKDAVIGANAVIVCGIEIGVNAFIGAGSVVTKDVPDGARVWGNPARVAEDV